MTTATKAPPTVTIGFAHKYRPWWIGVRCEWCNTGPVSSGCMVCGPVVERVRRLANHPDWKRWKTVLRTDPDANLVAGDWLEENGWPELADEARRTWTHIAPCATCKGRGRYLRNGHYADGTPIRARQHRCHACNGTGDKFLAEVISREEPQR